MKKYVFESFAPEFLALLKDVNEDLLMELSDDSDQEEGTSFREELEEEMAIDDFLTSDHFLLRALKSEKEDLERYLKKYFEAAEDFYNYFEYEYGRFGPMTRYNLGAMGARPLYLCWKYYDGIGDSEKANAAYFYMICKLTCYSDIEEEWLWLPYVKNDFDRVKGFIQADFLTAHPLITWAIGRCLIDEGKYAKARKFFKLGASLDYDGRQSIEPFIEVGKNKFELGMTYYKGLGVKQNYKEALKYFRAAASDAGEPSLPIIGDMYYEGLGVKQDYDRALECYCGYNRFNFDLDVYYKNMKDVQRGRLRELLERYAERPDLDVDDFNRLARFYFDRVNDIDKAKEYKAKAEKLASGHPDGKKDE